MAAESSCGICFIVSCNVGCLALTHYTAATGDASSNVALGCTIAMWCYAVRPPRRGAPLSPSSPRRQVLSIWGLYMMLHADPSEVKRSQETCHPIPGLHPSAVSRPPHLAAPGAGNVAQLLREGTPQYMKVPAEGGPQGQRGGRGQGKGGGGNSPTHYSYSPSPAAIPCGTGRHSKEAMARRL
jgi:hypothetical protein